MISINLEIGERVTALVLAGGRGTRIASIYPTTPKPMIPVLGRPFLHWLTLHLDRQGLRRFVYAAGYRAEQIEEWIKDGSFPHLSRIVRREDMPLGTGGAVLANLGHCGAWTLVVNGDGFCLGGLSDLLALTNKPGIDGGLIGVEVLDTSRYGSLDIADDGSLLRFREKIPGQGVVNGGIYLFRTALLAKRTQDPQSLERDTIPSLLAEGARLEVVRVVGVPFIDIGIPETLRDAEAFIRKNLQSGAL